MLPILIITEWYHCFIWFASTVGLDFASSHSNLSRYNNRFAQPPQAPQPHLIAVIVSHTISSATQLHCLHDGCAEITFLTAELPESRSSVALAHAPGHLGRRRRRQRHRIRQRLIIHTRIDLTLCSRYRSITNLSRRNPQVSDEPYDVHETFTRESTQPQQRQRPLQQQAASRPSSSSGSTRTLRRTPKLESRNLARGRVAPSKSPQWPRPTVPVERPELQAPPYLFSDEGGESTTPRASPNRPESSYWPPRSTRISRRTASAILYALEEAIRTPFLFTPDLAEEEASMSDLVSGGPIPVAGGNGRALNGGSRAASGPVPVPQYPTSGVRTPTVIMQQRRERDARKQAEREARQREQEEDEQRRAQGVVGLGGGSRTVAAGIEGGPVGGGDPLSSRLPTGYRDQGASASRRSGDQSIPQDAGERRRSDRVSGGSAARVNAATGPQPTTTATAGGRRQQPTSIPQGTSITAAGDSNMPQAPVSRPRGASVSQTQPRPVQSQTPRATSAPYSTQPQPSQSRQTSAPRATHQATAGPSTDPPVSQPTGGGHPRHPNTSSFPHAFERWETLSSHWEGLTSYWIRRLEQNSEELNREPLNQQLARQITDLSAAGANLFHAVVELQRLRASSERKFQRWFFETRADQEQARETQGEMENVLRTERLARTEAVANATRMEAEKATADQLVKEMRRELQISKEEARRAWEELGRREQEERDRTTSLRNGEPTLVGGVQVVPMMQGAPSRQASTNRPSTREGPYTGGTAPSAGRDMLRAQVEPAESPLEGGPGYSTYDPTRSETDTDPFTEGGRGIPPRSLQHEPDLPPLPRQQSLGTSAGATEAATVVYPPIPASQAPIVTPATSAASPARGGTYLQYGPGGTSLPTAAPFYQHQGTALHSEDRPRTTEPDERSYVPSVEDTISEDEYELDAHGQIRRDSQGQPIVYRRGPGSEDSDEYNVQEQLERERIHGQRYGSGISGVEYGTGSTATAGGTRSRPLFQGPVEQGGPVDYSGSGYGSGLGWEAVPRHHHPTRLSDVLEEDERSRTSASRLSQTSRSLH